MQHTRSIYLSTLPIPEALGIAKSAMNRDMLGTEILASAQASGRVTASAVTARLSSPAWHSAAMDGIAVRAQDTFAAREGRPILLRRQKDYVPVNTGNVMPEGFDAVIMIEQVFSLAGAAYSKNALLDVSFAESVHIENAAAPWQHVRRIGEDIVATEILFPRNHTLSPYDIGALLTAGVWEIPVWETVTVHIIPTGDEMLQYTEQPIPKPGQYIESNSHMLAALAHSLGCCVTRMPTVPDTLSAVTAALERSLAGKAHVTLLCAGSSAGSKDFSRAAIESVGKVLVHGIAAMPGKPSILGAAEGRLLVGVPGYPVSAAICCDELILPLICWLARRPVPERSVTPARFARKTASRPGVEEFIMLAAGRVGEEYSASPLNRGAGNTSTLAKAQAVASIPADSEGMNANEMVFVRLLRPQAELDRTLMCIGSHDNVVNLLADELMAHDPPFRLASSHAGSMGGIHALRNKACLLAGMHLFDPEKGDFNAPFLEKYLPDEKIVLINLAIREQGLIIPAGNPKHITGIHCLTRPGIIYINRQRGSGTRILFDHHLKIAGISPDSVAGYATEETTHMAVAINVLTGTADCGMGIRSAADALGLACVPVARERYDLAVPECFLEDERILAVLQLLRSTAFHARIQSLGGYDTSLTGQYMAAGQGLGKRPGLP